MGTAPRTTVRRIATIVAVAFGGASLTVASAAPPNLADAPVITRGQPVREVLLRLAARAGLSATVASDVTGTIDATLRSMRAEDGIRAICAQSQLLCTLEGHRLNVAVASSAVVPMSVARAGQAAPIVRAAFPRLTVRAQGAANALLLTGAAADVQAARTVIQGLDVRDPLKPRTELLAVHALSSDALAKRLRPVFRSATLTPVAAHQLLVVASPTDLDEIKRLAAALDAPTPAPVVTPTTGDAVRVSQRRPDDIARAVERQIAGVRASVSGSSLLLVGAPDAVVRAKTLVAALDIPGFADRYTAVYRIRTIDASSVADLVRRSFRDVEVTVDASLNAIAVTGTAAQQTRIADAIAQLDPAPSTAGAQGGAASSFGSGSGSSTEVVTLKSYVPGFSQGTSDATASFTQALQIVAPDVRVVQLPTPGQIALLGPPSGVRAAREFLAKVDVVPPLVVLDTEILELDETVAKNLGLQLGTAAVSTTFTEMTPLANADGTPPRLGRFQALSRTPISFTAQLNLLIQNGKGRVLADPRITTLSGRTASIRAGDTISILTTTAGNAGTIATTQVQSFQTGVQLDITPVVDSEGGIMVALHPVVNSLIGTNNGVPEISTRDTQTTVHLRDDETLVIGGLIQENDTRTTTKVPLLGDIPLLGRAFRNDAVHTSRNELIIVVTPHIVKAGSTAMPGPALHAMPSAAPLPTLPPNTQLPAPDGQLPRSYGPVRPATHPTPGPAPSTATVRSTEATPAAAAMPVATTTSIAATASPAPTPSAFAQTNVFTFGTPPQSNFAKSTDPAQIFYATFAPTVLTNGTPTRIAAISTTNVATMKLRIGAQTIALAQRGPGQWEATFPFPASSLSPGQTNVTLSLVAARADGTSSTVPIQVNVPSP